MSNTRHAKAGAAFSQERFCSSSEFEPGLLANLVAMRCRTLDDPAHAELIFFLQYLSHEPGGLRKVARDLLAAFPALVKGSSMKELGMDHATAALEDVLMELCLDPKSKVPPLSAYYFPKLIETLFEFQRQHAATARASLAETEISRQIFETLEYGLDGNCLVLADGAARTGKTYSAKAWCAMRPGRARYVQTPASSDDISFFRAIADALGLSSSLSLKGVQLRERVERTLQSSRLMLVMDESHYCFPQNNRREALPNRVNWIMTALVNHDVPVALITTAQFHAEQKLVENKTGWNSAQFIGRIAFYKALPDRLNEDELGAVARCHLPGGDAKSIELLVKVAQLSQSYVSGIEHAIKRARHEAGKQGHKSISFSDIKKAVQNYAIPSDDALNKALASAPGRSARPIGGRRPAATPAPVPAQRSIQPETEETTVNRLEKHSLTP